MSDKYLWMDLAFGVFFFFGVSPRIYHVHYFKSELSCRVACVSPLYFILVRDFIGLAPLQTVNSTPFPWWSQDGPWNFVFSIKYFVLLGYAEINEGFCFFCCSA